MIKSPTLRLLLGLLITLAAEMVFSTYALGRLSRLRQLQTQTINVNRQDSLLLFRIQNDLNLIGLRLRDMTEAGHKAGIAAYQGEFSRLRADLGAAIRADAQLAPVMRRADQQRELAASLAVFWRTADEVFAAAAAGHESTARRLAVTQLSPQQLHLSALVLSLVNRNDQTEAQIDRKVASIYSTGQRDIYANRKIFQRIEFLSGQRRILAARLITVQEEVLRSVSRELHDEFGQILTAINIMLTRAERKGVPPDSPLRTELKEVREITHNTREKMRSLSQMLHPAMIDDYGLVNAIEWYAGVFERQTGIRTTVPVTGKPVRITGQPAIQCFRIVQEALNNAAKHAHTHAAEVALEFGPKTLTIHIRDFGRGMAEAQSKKPGLGLIAMQERAELAGGSLKISSTPNAGTVISVTIPIRTEEQAVEANGADVIPQEEYPKQIVSSKS